MTTVEKIGKNAKRYWEGFVTRLGDIVEDMGETFDTWYDAGWSTAYVLLVVVGVVIGMLIAVPAYGDNRIVLHGVSDHGDDGNYVERNWGVGVEIDAGPRSVCDDYITGGYRNSHGNPAVYGMCSWDVGRTGRLSYDAQLGGVAGYVSVSSSRGDVGALPLGGVNTRADLPGPVDADLFVAPLIDIDDEDVGYAALLSASLPF